MLKGDAQKYNALRILIVVLGLFIATPDALSQESRIIWRVQLPGQHVPVNPALSLDSETIYVVDLSGDIRAISSDGTVLWTVADAGSQGVDVGPDGTIYAGDESHIVALNPDGTNKWTYSIPSPQPVVAYGPVVGPDGNIYHVGSDGFPAERGPFSLTPEGELRWETPIWFKPTVANSTPVFGLKSDGVGYQMIFISGSQAARVDLETGEFDAFGGGGAAVLVTTANGNIYYGGRGYDPDGNLLFITPNLIGAAANNGDLYSVWAGLLRLDPTDGSTIWSLNTPTGWNGNISPNPSDELLLCRGPGNAIQPPGTIRTADTQGNFLWSADLPVDDGRVSIMGTQAVFTPNGSTAYFGSSTLFQGPAQFCYLYAIEIEPATMGDLDGDGSVSTSDLLILLINWGLCPPKGDCPADLNGDGSVGTSDLQELFANWG